MLNHVFISYRQENSDHSRSVRRLGELLDQAGIPVELDEFYLDRHPGGPDEGWPKWCEDRAVQSACVLVIPSDGWFSAYNGTADPGVGRGAVAEASLVRQYIYDQKGANPRIRLAFVDSLPMSSPVPEGLRAWHQFHPLTSNADLDQLVAWIAGELGLVDVQSPTVHWPEPLNDFQPDLADRHIHEWPAIVGMLAGRSPHRILMIEAGSGYGKSELLHQTADYARRLGIALVRFDFKTPNANVSELLGQFDLDLGKHLPNFARPGGDKTHVLLKDLRALRRPVLVLLDSYEKAATLGDLVCQQLLPEVQKSLGLAMIVAGHCCPDADDARWRGMARCLRLGPIREVSHWEPWVARRVPDFRERKVDIPTLIMASNGVPKTFSDLCKTIAQGTP